MLCFFYMNKNLDFTHSNISNQNFSSSPISKEQIIEGSPVARSLNISSSPDSLLQSGLWDCTAGKFYWTFYCDEIVHIIEGSVTVDTVDGKNPRTLNAGDVAYFPHGLKTIWHVHKYVKKIAIHRMAAPAFLPKRILGALKRRTLQLFKH